MSGDMIFDICAPPTSDPVMQHPEDELRSTSYTADTPFEDLLQPIMRSGETVWERPTLLQARERARAQIEELDSSHKRFLNPHVYKVGLEAGLAGSRRTLITAARAGRMGRGDGS